MSENKKNIWKGLEQIDNKTIGFLHVPDAVISVYNVRQSELPEEKKEIEIDLAKNIKDFGLQQIPVATKSGLVYIGGRRLIAHDINKEEWMLCEQRNASPQEQIISSWTENYSRKNLDYLEEGKAFSTLCDMNTISERALAKKLGVSQSYISQRMRIWSYLNEYAVLMIKSQYYKDTQPSRVVTLEKARIIASSEVPETFRKEMINRIINDGITFEDLSKKVKDGVTKDFVMTQADHSIKLTIQQTYPDLWNEDLSVEKLKSIVTKLEGSSPKTEKHKVTLSDLLGEETRSGNVPDLFRKVASAFFSYYDGTFEYFELVAHGELSKISLKEKDPFKKDMTKDYGDLTQSLISEYKKDEE